MSRIANLTSIRGWVLIVVVGAAAYLGLGIPGVVAWIAGALSAMSASEPWEEDTDDERMGPWRPERSHRSEYVHRDRRLHFSAVYERTPPFPCPVYR